jgi:4a-hydroxytetrahydrobiopterin dehydratase
MTIEGAAEPTGKVHPVALGATQIISKLAQLDGWQFHGDGAQLAIEKVFVFDDYLNTLSFVNAVAFISQREDHHPEMLVQFNKCAVRYRTHDVQGISALDFVCAAQIDALLIHPTGK